MKPVLPLLSCVLVLLVRGSLSAAENRGAGYDDGRWTLVWADEFDRPGAPDPARWDYERGRVRNREDQFYTVDRRENARVADGRLVLTARREAWEGATCTSASLITLGRHEFTYGKVEVRAKVPAGRGTWPAIWMLGTNRRQVGWPRCGEIDLMEYVGFEPDRLHFNVHTKAANHTLKAKTGTMLTMPDVAAEFHRYGLIWERDRLEWYLDGRKVHEFVNPRTGEEAWPFDRPQYLILNLAIGGEWGGKKGVDDALFPAEFLVDYVRVWQKRER